MAGISDQAPLKLENRFKFNGNELNHKEFSDGAGLDWYSYGVREYDPQIGRFFRLDPITKNFYELTPYQYASNKNPEGWQGAVSGVGGSVLGVAKGLTHPAAAVKGLGRMMIQSPGQNAIDYGLSLYSQYGNSGSEAFTTYATYAHVLTDVALALSPLKEGGLANEGALASNVFDGLTSITDIGKTGGSSNKRRIGKPV